MASIPWESIPGSPIGSRGVFRTSFCLVTKLGLTDPMDYMNMSVLEQVAISSYSGFFLTQGSSTRLMHLLRCRQALYAAPPGELVFGSLCSTTCRPRPLAELGPVSFCQDTWMMCALLCLPVCQDDICSLGSRSLLDPLSVPCALRKASGSLGRWTSSVLTPLELLWRPQTLCCRAP